MAVANLSVHNKSLSGHLGTTQSVKWQVQHHMDEKEQEDEQNILLSPFEKVIYDMKNSKKVKNELMLGKRIGFYQLRGEIGTGNFSKVKLGIHCLTKDKVAIKIMNKKQVTQKSQQLFINEILCMEQLHHPNIIRLYEMLETQSRLYLVLEYADGGDLFTKISTNGRLSEYESKFIFIQIVSAVKHMHDNNVIHRDLKAENVLYSAANCVKLGDFGFSAVCPLSELLNTSCGSPPYAAPELFKENSYFGIHVDIWALGILLYFMVTATLPFHAETVRKLKKCILLGSYTIPAYVSDPCQKLIHGILQTNPINRFTLANILDSPWLKGMECPEPYQPFHLNPAHLASSLSLSEEEKEVKNALRHLGITEEHICNNPHWDCHSPITGIYRILHHRSQKRRYSEGPAMINNCPAKARLNENRKKRPKANWKA
ncbi:serine/threonine-protein kinase NIM1 isoform X2 [Stegostoma tigrinum]|uniref:serine/threonine-protein kinase NIM1 isoform X2 n=1 Tax=Stegostoma tigrinum TaxID=3053191 RepID=UPI00202ACB4F|nr:serine/threonine-protein kinase NIM1 isoform X2 [Stegostoma tigrinum]